ncbi:hypothetical protein [Psychromarinibacter sp. S121]|uniref:hypothetical protein n=1 Tax=Psychromarinibacter sp. S121 TaxID=3415127 RepID=UPI003C7D725C
MPEPIKPLILDGLDKLGEVRNLNRMFDMVSRSAGRADGDLHGISALAAVIDDRLAQAETELKRALQGDANGEGVMG